MTLRELITRLEQLSAEGYDSAEVNVDREEEFAPIVAAHGCGSEHKCHVALYPYDRAD